MDTEQPQPMTPEQWAEVSTRGALIAQLRGQREAGEMIMAELRRHRDLLRYVYWQTPGAKVKGDDENMIRVNLCIGEVRAIAALFVEEED